MNILYKVYSDQIKYGDILFISYNIIGKIVNAHKTAAKIMKLKQNLSKEVVWVMKDDGFINLIYFLQLKILLIIMLLDLIFKL